MFREQIHIFIEFENCENLSEGHVNGVDGLRVNFGPTGAQVVFFSAAGIPAYGWLSVLNHIVMKTLPLSFFPVLHLNFIIIGTK